MDLFDQMLSLIDGESYSNFKRKNQDQIIQKLKATKLTDFVSYLQNGAGLPADQYLRELWTVAYDPPIQEHSDIKASEAQTIITPFLDPETGFPYREVDHMLEWSDYQEWLKDQDDIPSGEDFKTETIYSFSGLEFKLPIFILLKKNSDGTHYILFRILSQMTVGEYEVSPFLGLLQYFKHQKIKVKKSKTKFKKRVPRAIRKRARKSLKIEYRIVKSVKTIYVGSPTHTAVKRNAPEYKVGVKGFWRIVKGIGKDADGRPVKGKTWVREHTRYNAKPENPAKIVYVKEPIHGCKN